MDIDIASEHPNLDEIWDWYTESCEFADAYFHSVTNLIDPGDVSSALVSKLIGLTDDELRDYFVAHRDKLNYATSTSILIHAERLLRVDSVARAQSGKRKVVINSAFRELYKASDGFVKMDQILGVWHDNSAPKVFGSVGALLHFRNWLAHGRFVKSKPRRAFHTPDLVYIEIKKLEKELERIKLQQP